MRPDLSVGAPQRPGNRLRPDAGGPGVVTRYAAGRAARATMKRNRPQAATISHPGRDAWARRPGMAPAARPPAMAMPMAEPTWRAVEVIAPATPARAGGRPLTAVLVIGALAKPNPMPMSR